MFMMSVECNRAHTKYGNVVGIREGDSIVFKGIPYAAPPTGNLRFAAPVPPACWQGDLLCDKWPADAYRHPDYAGQREGHVYDEDCLYLNLWRPATAGDKLPVLFWLYGGGGSSHDIYVDGRAFNARGCILISINYRMGILGNFGLEELAQRDAHGSTGAYGIMDILFALQWVRDNVSAFGGDADNVTVFGHSAGAMFTKLLLGCRPAHGLFRRIVSLSGGGTWDIDVVHTKESKCRLCRQLLDNAGWTLEDMMTRTPEEIYSVLMEGEKELNLPQKSMLNTLFHPSMDGWLIRDYYGKLLHDGDVDREVDVMCGMLVEEWHNFICQIPGGIGDYQKEFALASVIAWARRYNACGIKPIYTYFFDRIMPGGGRMVHGNELPYVFGCLDYYERPWTEFDREISDAVIGYLTNFARTGDPNGEGLAAWHPYTKERPVTMHYTDTDIREEAISGDERTERVVAYLLEHPGMLEDSFL